VPYTVTSSVDGSLTTREFDGPDLSLGRSPPSDILLDDQTVAAQHARVVVEDRNFVITDLETETGTFVNGERIESVFLADKDCIRIASFELLVSFAGPDNQLGLRITRIEDTSPLGAGVNQPGEISYSAAYTLRRDVFDNNSFKRWLSASILGGILVAIPLLFLYPRALSPGTVSQAHTFIGNQCSQCHVFPHGPSNQKCEGCHKGPLHHDNQVSNPTCVSCHAEHRGMVKLSFVDNRECTQCHGALKTKDSKTQTQEPSRNFIPSVTDFVTDHPQFAISVREQDDSGRPQKKGKLIRRIRLDVDGKQILRPSKGDDKFVGFNQQFQGMIKLNHRKHVGKPIARKSDDDKVQLGCSECHTPAADGKRMQKITFANHCSGCHQNRHLQIDPNADDKKLAACTVPHGSEERVREYLIVFFSENECQPFPALELDPRLLMTKLKGQPTQSVQDKVKAAEESIYRDRCAYCHKVDRDAMPWPKVVNARIPERWFDHAEFDHKKHRLVKCESCHSGFGWRSDGSANEKKLVSVNPYESTETEDILIPGIETCRNCHRDSKSSGGAIQGTATTACGACHLYHDKDKDKNWSEKLPIEQKPVPTIQRR